MWTKGFKIASEGCEAGLDFLPVPGEKVDVISGRTDLADVTQEAGVAVDADVAEDVSEEVARLADEWVAVVFFVFPRRFAHDCNAIGRVESDGLKVWNDPPRGYDCGEVGLHFSWMSCSTAVRALAGRSSTRS